MSHKQNLGHLRDTVFFEQHDSQRFLLWPWSREVEITADERLAGHRPKRWRGIGNAGARCGLALMFPVKGEGVPVGLAGGRLATVRLLKLH